MLEFILVLILFIWAVCYFPFVTISITSVIIISVGGLIYLSEKESNRERNEIAKVYISASLDYKSCGNNHPIKLSISNNSSNKTVYYTDVNIYGYNKGYSKYVFVMRDLKSDKIVGPNQKFEMCFYVPAEYKNTDINNLVFEANKNYSTDIR